MNHNRKYHVLGYVLTGYCDLTHMRYPITAWHTTPYAAQAQMGQMIDDGIMAPWAKMERMTRTHMETMRTNHLEAYFEWPTQ